jgi:hypothetical protein
MANADDCLVTVGKAKAAKDTQAKNVLWHLRRPRRTGQLLRSIERQSNYGSSCARKRFACQRERLRAQPPEHSEWTRRSPSGTLAPIPTPLRFGDFLRAVQCGSPNR